MVTKPLLAIENKRGFKLTVSFAQTQIMLDPWQHIINMFREPVNVFESEGATVKVSFEYRYNGDDRERDVVYGFTSAVRDLERDWKSDARIWLEKVSDGHVSMLVPFLASRLTFSTAT